MQLFCIAICYELDLNLCRYRLQQDGWHKKQKMTKMKINAKAKKLIINFCTSCLYPAMPFKTPILLKYTC